MQPSDVVADRFVIERVAGSGGMGTVYCARDRADGARVAIKLLHGGRTRDDARFDREARVLAELRHPGIVRYVAHGELPDGRRWLALEWLDGEDLAARLERTGLTIAESVALAARVAAGLGAAHARGVVHRDVKPSNVFLVDRDLGKAKVLDFGVARSQTGRRALTRSGDVLGTPQYMAPEQARGERVIDARADVFALGCVLFECLTGRPVFEGVQPLAIMTSVLLQEAPRLADLRPAVPTALDDLVARMLDKGPERRPADASAVLIELAELGELDASSRPRAVPRPPAITRNEGRFVCFVAARALPRAAQGSHEPTPAATEAEPRVALLRSAAERYGATLNTLADGTAFLVLGGPRAATDLAMRAARCALALHAALREAPIAVSSGRTLPASSMPMADVIERAAKLLRAGGSAPRLDDATAGLLDASFDVGSDEHGLTLVGERGSDENRARTVLGKATACVDRQRELEALRGFFEECTRERVARAILVTGPPGIGKTRLRQEFLTRLRAENTSAEVWMARGDPLRSGSPYGVLAQLVRHAAGFVEGDPLATRRHRLRARVGRRLGGADATRVADFLGELTGTPFADEESMQLRAARADAMLMGDQMRRAWEEFVSAECAAQPLLLVLEDLHWSDAPSTAAVDATLRRLAEERLVVLGIARPAVHDALPRLWQARGVQEIRLGELARRASEQLVRQVLGEECDAGRVERIVGRAGGNAFYLEEVMRATATPEPTRRCRRRSSGWSRRASPRWTTKRGASSGRRACSARPSGAREYRPSSATHARRGCVTASKGWSSSRWSFAASPRSSPTRRSTRSATASCATPRTPHSL